MNGATMASSITTDPSSPCEPRLDDAGVAGGCGDAVGARS